MSITTKKSPRYVIPLVKSVIFYPKAVSFLETAQLDGYMLESSFFFNYRKCTLAHVKSIGFRHSEDLLEINSVI